MAQVLLLRVERLQAPGAGHCHARQIPGLFGGQFRPLRMNPRVLVADVGHLKEVGIEARLANGVAENRFVGAWCARRDNDAVQAVLGNPLLDELERIG